MEKFVEMNYLIDIYQNLLTKRQLDSLKLYYEENYTFSEIADLFNISRQASYDLLKRAEEILFDYDDKLKLVKKYLENKKALEVLGEIIKGESFSSKETALQIIDALKKNV